MTASSKPPTASRTPATRHLHGSDLRGLTRLATQAVTGVTDIVEGVHQSVWRTLGVDGAEAGRTGGLTGLVYRSVRGVARGVGGGVDVLLQTLQGEPPQAAASSAARDAFVAALNGVMGDRLVADANPLATSMSLRHDGAPLPAGGPAAASGKVLLLAHGLCMNDRQWRGADGHDHGAALAAALGYTPLYLRYNSGLHTSQNGRELAQLLEHTLARWPVPIDEIAFVAHSMGGLVVRSAIDQATRSQQRWTQRVRHAVFLGTPHHGAPLERAGNWVDALLASTRYTAPFALLGQVRSAGITDLRHGHVRDEDWTGHDRFARRPDARSIVPLPAHIACHAIGATTAGERSTLADHLLGDGLVPLRSALGQHDDATRELDFVSASRWIAYRTNHMQLLGRREVTEQMIAWLR